MNEQVVDLGFKPRPWQLQALSALKRFSVLVVHRRGGKTLAAVMKLIDAALRCDKSRGRYGYLAPELKQAKGLAWDYLRHYALKVPQATVNESELWVAFPNGARIRIYGADTPDNLRGLYFDGLVLDEVAQMKPQTWGEVLLPALADRGGWAMFIGTPKGINLFSKLYFDGQVNPDWYAQLFDIDATKALSESELTTMRQNMSDQQWRQEMLCDFNASTDETLIPIDLVRKALGGHLSIDKYDHAPKVIGVDVARMGGDRTVIQTRQGLAAFPPNKLNVLSTTDIADVVALTIDTFQSNACFIDVSGGYGGGVYDRLVTLNYAPVGVQFGGSSGNPRFVNKRTEMWWSVKEWLERGGVLPKDQDYLVDLTGPRYDYKNVSGHVSLESKDHMKARGIRSPDVGDALALTFAFPVAAKPVQFQGYRMGEASRHSHEYDPWARFAEEQKREFGS